MEETRKKTDWKTFTEKMRGYYKPTENIILKHFQFRQLAHERNESFSAFFIRVEKAAKHCQFSCEDANCSDEKTAVRDQIVIGLENDGIQQEALENSWDFKDLRSNGVRMESAYKGAAEITGDGSLNKIGKYSYGNVKNQVNKDERKVSQQKQINCYFCGNTISGTPISKHTQQCPARSAKCRNCGKTGHYANVCRSKKDVSEVTVESDKIDFDNGDVIYNVNILRVTQQESDLNDEFKVELIVNNNLDHGRHRGKNICMWDQRSQEMGYLW